ncbi:MAG: hypothetical protein AAF685_03755 [Cyanobacteria bacterium P01_C01_bin.89]
MLRRGSALLILLALTACTNSAPSSDAEALPAAQGAAASSSPQQSAEASPSEGLSYDNFLTLSFDDSLERVQEKLGMDGELSGTANPETGLGDTYAFPSRDAIAQGGIPFVSVSFDNEGKLLSTQQYGLAIPQGNIKLEQFNQVKVGEMKRQDVEKIFGVSGVLGGKTRPDKNAIATYGDEIGNNFNYQFMSSDGSLAVISVDDNDLVTNQVQENTKYQPPAQ